MEEVLAKMGTGGLPREQWEHKDKEAEDVKKGEDAMQRERKEGEWPSQPQL